MDPTRCLRGILETLDTAASGSYGLDPQECADLKEDIEALGQWLKHGGFLPAQWQKIKES